MKPLDNFIQAVKQFRDRNVAREAKRLNKLIELEDLNKAIQALEQVSSNEVPHWEHILASIKELEGVLITFGKFPGHGGLREEAEDLYRLIISTDKLRKTAIHLMVEMELAGSIRPYRVARLVPILAGIDLVLRHRIEAIEGLKQFRFC